MDARLEKIPTTLNISPFNIVFASPYKTRESQAAVDFWLHLTSPESTDCPVTNALHSTLGGYVPQAAWHLQAVRHSLLSAASAAFVLEARWSNMSTELQSTFSKQAIIQRSLAVRDVLEEKQPSLSTVLTAVMLATVSVWTGQWEEYKQHLVFCLNLGHEVRGNGEQVSEDLLTSLDAMLGTVRRLPVRSSCTTKRSRTRYAYGVLCAAKEWIDDLIADIKQANATETLNFALQGYRTRMAWMLYQWENHGNGLQGNHGRKLRLENTPFVLAVQHVQDWPQLKGDCSNVDFDLRLLTTRLTMALKTTILFGSCGDAQSLKDAAMACHAKVTALSCDESSEQS